MNTKHNPTRGPCLVWVYLPCMGGEMQEYTQQQLISCFWALKRGKAKTEVNVGRPHACRVEVPLICYFGEANPEIQIGMPVSKN